MERWFIYRLLIRSLTLTQFMSLKHGKIYHFRSYITVTVPVRTDIDSHIEAFCL